MYDSCVFVFFCLIDCGMLSDCLLCLGLFWVCDLKCGCVIRLYFLCDVVCLFFVCAFVCVCLCLCVSRFKNAFVRFVCGL